MKNTKNIINIEKLTYIEIANLFRNLKEKPHLSYNDKMQLYQLANILINRYDWNINDEAFLGMYEDEDEEFFINS